MKTQPDSLLVAIRKAADILGMSWSEAAKYYRELQGEIVVGDDGEVRLNTWLPKSAGRKIWSAQPSYAIRFLCAVAGTERPELAREVLEWAQYLTLDGRDPGGSEKVAAGVPSPIENALVSYLGERAGQLSGIEVRPDEREIIVRLKSGEEQLYKQHNAIGAGRDDVPRPYKGLVRRGVISGTVFFYLASAVNWAAGGGVVAETEQATRG